MKKLEWLWVMVRTKIKKGEDLIKKDSRFQKTNLKSFSQAFQNQGWSVEGGKGRVEMKKMEWLSVVVRTTIKKGEDLIEKDSIFFLKIPSWRSMDRKISQK